MRARKLGMVVLAAVLSGVSMPTGQGDADAAPRRRIVRASITHSAIVGSEGSVDVPGQSSDHPARCAWHLVGAESQGLIGYVVKLRRSEADGRHHWRMTWAATPAAVHGVKQTRPIQPPAVSVWLYRRIPPCETLNSWSPREARRHFNYNEAYRYPGGRIPRGFRWAVIAPYVGHASVTFCIVVPCFAYAYGRPGGIRFAFTIYRP